MEIRFTVLGEPQGKGRPRFRTVAGHAQTYTPDATASYENLIACEYRRQCNDYVFPAEAELDLRVYAYMRIPKSTSKIKQNLMRQGIMRPTKKPDVDNIFKIVADALNGIAYSDDKAIVDCQVRKFYSDRPRLVVIVRNCKKGEIQNEIL